MTQVEFYNAAVKVYRETGQGVPGFLRMKLPSRVIDGLIEKGLMKSVVIPFNHLPDDETLCITKGYCVEEDIVGDKRCSALAFLRFYKSIPQGLEHIGMMGNEKLAQDPEFMEKYAEWLKLNHAKLTEKVTELSEDMVFGVLSKDAEDYLKTREWYTDNESVEKALDSLRDKNRLILKSISLNKEMRDLTKGEPRHQVEYNKSVKQISEDESELKLRHEIEDYLETCKNKKVKIQTFINDTIISAALFRAQRILSQNN